MSIKSLFVIDTQRSGGNTVEMCKRDNGTWGAEMLTPSRQARIKTNVAVETHIAPGHTLKMPLAEIQKANVSVVMKI